MHKGYFINKSFYKLNNKMIYSVLTYFQNNTFIICVILAVVTLVGLSMYGMFDKSGGSYNIKDNYYEYYIPANTNTNKQLTATTHNTVVAESKDSKGETECRRVLVNIFNRPFNKSRPDFLKNPVTGNAYNLELDCFEADMRLGLEYNGRQHYEYTSFFHKNKEQFYNQKYRDDMKQRMCKDNGITLITVPYTVPVPRIEDFIRNELRTRKLI